MPAELSNTEIEAFIRQAYQQNFDLLKLETGIALTAEVKEAGLQQVLFYWQKMRDVAENVSETEVRLSLPGQRSPENREFGIEGVVDIVREEGKTMIYDIKTHEVDYVRANISHYEGQLNVYAHIWKELQQKDLDGTAIICTDLPNQVKEALSSANEAQLQRALENWDPLVEIEFDLMKVQETICAFGEVVDQIEDREFEPRSVEELREPYTDRSNVGFGTHVCRNCDARFSCAAYRVYVRHGRGRADQIFENYYNDLEVGEPLEEWRTAGLDTVGDVEDLI